MIKICSTCNIEKEDTLFRKNRGQCLECFRSHCAEYRAQNKNKIKVGKKVYYENNSNEIKENSIIYYENNKEYWPNSKCNK